ncbi:unnamed protein product [Fraxinus pennsylvanica]|uniref:Uncharacterized protein n=1 Tax=Fraxinus pennsylvanica TaxID=56036 RepID=A0AAD1ZZZ9_9LAMI|nr:unnamed protein product [Fraxinus pennsylvanica]
MWSELIWMTRFFLLNEKSQEHSTKFQGLDAQRFIGRFLESASKRLPEEELMLDPFLALGDRDDKPKSKNEIQKPFLNDNIKLEDLQLNEDLLRTNPTITGKLNPEDETIFAYPMFLNFRPPFNLCIL